MIHQSPEVLTYMSALNESAYILEAEKDRMGPDLFLRTTYGYSDEPESETSEENIHYQKLTVTGGISFPILGTWNGEKIRLLKAELERLKGEALLRKSMETTLTSLRKAYIVIWAELRKERLIEAFLADAKEAEKILKERKEKGLLLEADRLEFMSAFDMAKRDLESSKMRIDQALGAIRLATGKRWSIPESCEAPTLPGPQKDTESLYDNIPRLADLYYRDKAMELKGKIAQLSEDLEREGTIELGVSAGKDFPGGAGSGVYVSATIKNPFNALNKEEDPLKLAAEESLKKEQQDRMAAEIRMEEELSRILKLREYALKSIEANGRRLQSAEEAIRENSLRHSKLPGDTFEQLLKSRYSYLRASLDLIDAQSLFLQTEAELAVFAYPPDLEALGGNKTRYFPLKVNSGSLTPLNDNMMEPSLLLSAYVWDPSPFLNAETRKEEVQRLRFEGFKRMLVSFNNTQLRYLETPEGKASLRDLIEECHRQGITVDLLLGDPNWLLEKERPKLLKLVKSLSPFPFRGIHLDIEPDSLPGAAAKRKELAQKLVDTVKDVARTSPLPVSLSIHPRYLEGELGRVTAPGFEDAGLEYAAVMIYSSTPQNVAKRAKTIMASYPHLKIGVAQSVESCLSEQESYASAGRAKFHEGMAYIEENLASPQFEGIFVQSWKEYKEMKP